MVLSIEPYAVYTLFYAATFSPHGDITYAADLVCYFIKKHISVSGI